MIIHRQYLNFLYKTRLTQSQFLLLHLLYKEDFQAIQEYKNNFPSEDNYMIGEYLTKDLIKKGWIKEKENGKLYITEEFRMLYVNKFKAIDELVEAYPAFIEKEGGLKIPLVTIDKNRYASIYEGCIKFSQGEHEEVLKDLKYAKEKGLLTFGLSKFIDSEYWLTVRNLRKKEKEEGNIDEEGIFQNDFE